MRASSVCAFAAAAIGTAFIALYLLTALARVSYPFDLEWGEGLFVDHVARLVRGQQLYVAPSINFVPLVYTPGYYYVGALASKIFGLGLTTLRGVSIVCSLALLGLLVQFGRREYGSTRDGLVLAGLFAACYAATGAWLDIVRVDALLLLLIVGATYLIRFSNSTAALVVAGVLLAGAVLTKQVALTIAPPLLLYAWIRRGWIGLVAGAAFAVALAAAVAVLQWMNHGWFLYYTFTVLSKAQSAWTEHPLAFWTSDMLGRFGIGTVAGIVWCLIAWRLTGFRDWSFYVVMIPGILASTWEARVHPGAWFNTLMPAFLFLGMATIRLVRQIDLRIPVLGWLVVLVQFALLVYNPAPYIPTSADRDAAEQVVALIRHVPGDVLMLDHAHYTVMAGKRTHAHEMPMRDVFAVHDRWERELKDEMRRAIDAQQFDVVLQDSPDWFPVPLGERYRAIGRLLSSDALLKQRVGNPIHPAAVYVPKDREVQWPPVLDDRQAERR